MMMFMYVDLFIGVICSSFCLGSVRLPDKSLLVVSYFCKPGAHQCEVLDLKFFMRFLHSDIGLANCDFPFILLDYTLGRIFSHLYFG
jgi:hypothetical protein